MLTYTELHQRFLNQLNAAIDQYQVLYAERRMPAHRAADIAAITQLLAETPDVEYLRAALSDLIRQFKTGWFIFKTGKSRLKDSLAAELCHPQFSSDAFLKGRIIELEQLSRSRPLLALEAPWVEADSEAPNATLQQALVNAQKTLEAERYTIQTLESKNRHLCEELLRLTTENESLRKMNHRLSKERQAERFISSIENQRAVESEEDDMPFPFEVDHTDSSQESRTISPGTSIARSFGTIPTVVPSRMLQIN